MTTLKNVVALIPARGGSKGVPRKNIKDLHGKPLIAWTIEAAKQCPAFDRIIVSTEDEEISRIATAYGADVPFVRPRELAQDSSRGIDVVLHAIEWLNANSNPCEVVVLLQPTSPLRTPADISGALDQFIAAGADAIVSVCPVEHPPFWSNTLPEDKRMDTFLNPDIVNKNRQEIPQYYRLNGSIYVARSEFLKRAKTFFGKKTFAYIMPAERSIDIDSDVDFELCSLVLGKFTQ